jgi:short-subunit dehydrogenase involved in D-alanine esterification of teichoic acids
MTDITGRRKEVLDQSIKVHGPGLKGSLHAIQADVSSKEDLQKVASQISEGYLNILVK